MGQHCSSIDDTAKNLQPINLLEFNASINNTLALLPHQRSCSKKGLKLIDHQSVFLSDESSLLNGMTFYFDEYIVGLKACYEVHSKPVVLDLMGSGQAKQKFTLTLKEDEFIEHIVLYYDDVAIICMKIQTTDGAIFTIGNFKNGKDVRKREVDLRREKRIILGFKGLVGEFLQDLWVYHAEIELLEDHE